MDNIVPTSFLVCGHEDINEWNKWKFTKEEIYRVKLSDKDFEGANLSNANLSSADLLSSNLKRVTLKEADLTNANLSGANLEIVDFSNALLTDANLGQANLSNATFKHTYLINTNLENANLSGIKLEQCYISRENKVRTVDTYMLIGTNPQFWNENTKLMKQGWSYPSIKQLKNLPQKTLALLSNVCAAQAIWTSTPDPKDVRRLQVLSVNRDSTNGVTQTNVKWQEYKENEHPQSTAQAITILVKQSRKILYIGHIGEYGYMIQLDPSQREGVEIAKVDLGEASWNEVFDLMNDVDNYPEGIERKTSWSIPSKKDLEIIAQLDDGLKKKLGLNKVYWSSEDYRDYTYETRYDFLKDGEPTHNWALDLRPERKGEAVKPFEKKEKLSLRLVRKI